MLYLGIDQHSKQLTVSLRDEEGGVMLRRQVSTRPEGLWRVVIPTRWERELRELTSARQRLGRMRTRTLNQMQNLLRRHKLSWECPTRNFQTRAASVSPSTGGEPLAPQPSLRCLLDSPHPAHTTDQHRTHRHPREAQGFRQRKYVPGTT